MHDASRQAFEAAEELFRQAIQRGPNYAPPLTWLAYWHVMRVGQEWSPSPEEDTAKAEHFAKLACECDPSDPMAIAVRGHIAGYLHKDFDQAFAFFERALEINPNSSRAWLWNSNAHAWIGQGPEAVAKVKRATALSPFDPMKCSYSGGAAMAYLAAGQYAEAAEAAMRCIRDNRTYTTGHKLLIIALSLANRAAEARAAVRPMLALDPAFSVERYRRRFPGSEGPLADLFCEALASAGVPRAN
jgi:tetratricopeptide (TPR) repeat protein